MSTIGDNPNVARFAVYGNGFVYAREVKVRFTNPYPDYVFHESYTLPTLDSVRAYIQENRRLPLMPDGCQVEEEGLGLGEDALRQTEHIERLYLYILQLEQRLSQLEAQQR
jgi:hypothetical protein